MRTRGFRLFAIMSMLALLFGGQLCMLVQCSPERAAAQAPTCCARGAAHDPAPERPASHDASKPCCIQVTVAASPELQPPAIQDLHALTAVLVAAQLAAAPLAAFAPSPPADVPAPPPAPPIPAAGPRAPPLA